MPRHFPWQPEARAAWKTYPVRVSGELSGCHKVPTLLVQSMRGGFVTANCPHPDCNSYQLVTHAQFEALDLWVACPKCRRKMMTAVIKDNYAFTCSTCDLYFNLADILPNWPDIAVVG